MAADGLQVRRVPHVVADLVRPAVVLVHVRKNNVHPG